MQAGAFSMNLNPIGFVRNTIVQNSSEIEWRDMISEIVIYSEYAQALDNLEEFSHLIVLCWLHFAERDIIALKIHPKRKPEAPLIGLFATRSPNRPNPISNTTVKLLSHEGNILRVKGLDVYNGTPVIDIKPYLPGNDSVSEAVVPQWINKNHSPPS
jgi:tRNA (adenine37-N6)-methyltransferase